jgi:Holliday junction resolvasome RuvABC endonuclease subunit
LPRVIKWAHCRIVFGGAQKDQVARIIMRLLGITESPDKLDVTDALAVTLCAVWRQKSDPLVKVL